jgi:hypothetical protein
MDELEIPKNEEQVTPVVKQRTKKSECKVILVLSDIIGIRFEGYGISLPQTEKTKNFKVGDIVKVQYHSEIGKGDFDINII